MANNSPAPANHMHMCIILVFIKISCFILFKVSRDQSLNARGNKEEDLEMNDSGMR